MTGGTVPVIDFRRSRLSLQWDISTGTWAAYDEPPGIVHGVGFIRATGPNVCLYATGETLQLQVDTRVFALAEPGSRVSCRPDLLSLGLRRSFRLDAADGPALFRLGYWATRHNDFFRWLAAVARQAGWRQRTAQRWTEGLSPASLREEVNPPVPLA